MNHARVPLWRDGRVADGARLESVYRLIPYRGFESPSLRIFRSALWPRGLMPPLAAYRRFTPAGSCLALGLKGLPRDRGAPAPLTVTLTAPRNERSRSFAVPARRQPYLFVSVYSSTFLKIFRILFRLLTSITSRL